MMNTSNTVSNIGAREPERSAEPAERGKTSSTLKLGGILLWALVATLAFHTAYITGRASYLVVLYLFALVQLTRAGTWRKTYYAGLAVGFLIAVVWLTFFWRIFSAGSMALWYVFAFWIGLFITLAGACLRATEGSWPGWLLIPFLWTGLEYFRSELYYLRFSWLSPGYAFAQAPDQIPLKAAGAYGIGFLLMCVACAAAFECGKSKARSFAVLALGAGGIWLAGLAGGKGPTATPTAAIRVAGLQLECPAENEVLLGLNDLIRKHPDLDLIVLSEYTFLDPIPQRIKDWCRKNRRYLIVGGEDPAPPKNFYNTVFVIGPTGEIVFRQAKAVPIQFFKDGLPAPEQQLWDSPWGKIGICICYDLSYTRVTDRLVRLGAQALIVPTMDVMNWGRRQHQLHARIAPTRAAEYGIPIFRLASSGISQLVDGAGHVREAAPCPGDGAAICGTIEMRKAGKPPLDRWLAPFATGVTGVTMLRLFLRRHLGTRVWPNRSEPTERLRRSVDAQPIGISRILLNLGVFWGRTCYRRGATDAEGQSRNHTEREDRRQKNLGTEKFFCPQIFLSLFLLVGATTAGETHFFSIPDFRPLFA